MRAFWAAVPWAVGALCCTSWAYAQVEGGGAIIDSKTAVSFGVLLSLGTVLGAVAGAWGATARNLARIEERLEERTRAICQTLDRHEHEISELRDRAGR